MHINRLFTTTQSDPYSDQTYTERTPIAHSKSDRACPIFVPDSWSQLAVDIVGNKYVRKTGVPQANGELGRETDAREVFRRLAEGWMCVSSGLMSWLKIGDTVAGAITSGGTTRRAAKMVILSIEHSVAIPLLYAKLLCLLLLLLAAPSSAADTVSPRAAEQWLDRIDQHQYQLSWDTASAYLKKAIRESQWERTLTAHRQPFGALISRHHQRTDYRTTLPGVPNGQYAILHFVSSFQERADALETVVLTKEPDGTWKTIGYTIK